LDSVNSNFDGEMTTSEHVQGMSFSFIDDVKSIHEMYSPINSFG